MKNAGFLPAFFLFFDKKITTLPLLPYCSCFSTMTQHIPIKQTDGKIVICNDRLSS